MPKCTDNDKDAFLISENAILSLEVKDGKIIGSKKIGKYLLIKIFFLFLCRLSDFQLLIIILFINLLT